MTQNDDVRWSPAVIVALFNGDLENALIAATPGGIEAQEAAGQRSFVASETLPCKSAGYHSSEEEMRQQLESLGIEFVEPVDDLFWYVRLPGGWKKEATDHSMWSKLYDDRGRERASIFYKAAFYDRSAHISLTRRYNLDTRPVDGWNSESWGAGTIWNCVVTDCKEIIWTSQQTEPEPEEPGREWWDAKDAISDAATDWLDEHYPEWRDPLAYWD